MYKKVLAGVDGSETSLKAFRAAAQQAKSHGAELVAFCSYTPPDAATLEKWRQEAPSDISWKMSQTAAADEALEKAAKVGAEEGIDVIKAAQEGEPAEAILAYAESNGIDLIVVGSVGMTGTKRFLLGSVPNKVSHHAPCDVLIVKTG